MEKIRYKDLVQSISVLSDLQRNRVLSSLDISKNIKLTSLEFSNNLFK